MTDERITPDEFARLMALPEADPERRRAESTAEFAGMKALFTAFEAEGATRGPEDDAIRDELARRLSTRLPATTAGAGRASGASPRAAAPERTPGGWLAVFLGPSGRRALAFAVLVAVAGAGVWMTRRPREDVVRGEGPGAFTVTASAVPGGVALAWPRVPGADGYRVTLLGADLGEVARFDVGDVTTWSLRGDSLPARVAPGSAISVEVQALQKGARLSTTPARAIRLP